MVTIWRLRFGRLVILAALATQSGVACGQDHQPSNDNQNLPDAALPAECGDGLLAPEEECDEGAANSDAEPDGCRSSCRLPFCGDGVVDTGEACDGSDLGGATCTGLGFLGGALICTGACELDTGGCEGATCGNGEMEGSEGCDDGNTEDGDGCSAACSVEAGWDCADGACVTVCGDDLLRGDEGCDDGNTEDGDGCSATCTIEIGWDCAGEPSTCVCAPYYHGSGCGECRVHVDTDGVAASPDGLTWLGAFLTVQEGIAAAAARPTACEVWVAEGIYLAWNGAQSDSIQLAPGVAVYGGFAGGEASRALRDWIAHPTRLDGREPGSTWRRVFHVVTGAEEALLDGFVVSGGRADGESLNGRGGGLLISGVASTVASCRFEDNEARWGGAMYVGVGSTVEVQSSTFVGNLADYGGAVASVDSSAVLTNLLFQGNSVSVSGGAVYALLGRLRVMDSAFDLNHSEIDGGGLVGVDALVEVEGSTFTSNTAHAGGALLAYDGALLSITGVLLDGNQARQGAGMYAEQATLSVRNSDVIGNVSPEPNDARGAGLFAFESTVSLEDCQFAGNGTGAQLTHAGGAIYLDACPSAEMTWVDFLSNGSGAGGAIWSRDTTLVVAWCRFLDNHASGGALPNGGAIDLHGGELDLFHSELRQNSADQRGGAVSVSAPSGSVRVATCLLAGNSAGEKGSELALGSAGAATLVQSTISGSGASVVAVDSSSLTIVNSVLDGTVTLDAAGTVQLDHCLVPTGFSHTCVSCIMGLPGFEGGGDYHLAAGSLAVDAGDASLNPTYPDGILDLDGSEWGSPRDLGCYVYPFQ